MKTAFMTVKKTYTIVELREGGNLYGIGIARCSDSDNWSPKKGVRIAVARAMENHWKIIAANESGGDMWRVNGWPDKTTAVAYLSKVLNEMESKG